MDTGAWFRGIKDDPARTPPIADLLDFKIASLESGHCEVVFHADAKTHGNPLGTLHGGILCDIGDAAMGLAFGASLEEGETFTTLALHINFFKPIWKSTLRAKAHIVRKTKSIALVDCEVHDENNSLVARLSSTCMVLRGPQAKGR